MRRRFWEFGRSKSPKRFFAIVVVVVVVVLVLVLVLVVVLVLVDFGWLEGDAKRGQTKTDRQ